jgi:hypothetical protein
MSLTELSYSSSASLLGVGETMLALEYEGWRLISGRLLGPGNSFRGAWNEALCKHAGTSGAVTMQMQGFWIPMQGVGAPTMPKEPMEAPSNSNLASTSDSGYGRVFCPIDLLALSSPGLSTSTVVRREEG